METPAQWTLRYPQSIILLSYTLTAKQAEAR